MFSVGCRDLTPFLESIQFASGETIDLSNDSAIPFYYQGTSGDDTIYASSGVDVIEGGQGNDTLNGLAGDDTYIFNIGDGKDVINESANYVNDVLTASHDAIQFGAGITKFGYFYETQGRNFLSARNYGLVDRENSLN